MAVRTTNGTSAPMPLYGSVVQNGVYSNSPYLPSYYGAYATTTTPAHKVISITYLNQVVGFVPVFNCEDAECRNGKYGSNDTEFMLPVFAERQLSTTGNYKNDFNSWLFDIPALSGLLGVKYFIDRKIGDTWTEQDEIVDNSYGKYYPVGILCDRKYYTGFEIQWNKVLYLLGEGIYRLRVQLCTGSFTESTNHLKITESSNGAWLNLTTTDYGLICPTFFLNPSISLNANMINLVAFINTYQTTTYADPLFSAEWNSGTSQIDLFGLLGQNCACNRVLFNCAIANYVTPFSGGTDTLECTGCFVTPPFCLKTWDCWAVDRTSRFDATYTGGVIGNVDKAYPGTTWSFCCSGKPIIYPNQTSLLIFKIRQIPYSVTAPYTLTFTMDFGYDLVPPIVIAPATTYVNASIQITNAINAYQATLGTQQFSAYYNTALQQVEITNLFGQNITFTVQGSPFSGTNYINWYYVGQLYSAVISGTTITQSGIFKGGMNVTPSSYAGTPIVWKDSIRVGGLFGYENTEYERKSIKYQTGVVNKVRDELILTHTWRSMSMPFWFHERFKAYGLMADTLLASDYNMNNSDYGIKLYSVQGDSSYNPDYKNHPRESAVKCDFKPRTQNIKRSRCC